MNVILASYDLIPEKSHLMPWRYICEVASYFNKNGHQAIVVSLGSEIGKYQLDKEKLFVNRIRKHKKHLLTDLKSLVDQYEIDVIIWPVSWREKKYRLQALRQMNKPIVGYFPGGMYALKDVIHMARSVGLKDSLPYILEVISPKKRQLKRFINNGIKDIIALTDWTAQCISEYGWDDKNITVTLPGKENNNRNDSSELPAEFSQWLEGSRYILFMGPPTPIRGCYELLNAFNQVASQEPDVKLVCLFRSDIGVDQSKMKTFIKGLSNKNRIYTAWESLDRLLLERYISNSYAIALPFIIVPSEIPLALIDAASYGKAVITTSCGGSGKYAEQYGVVINLTIANDFKNKLLMLLDDSDYYLKKCAMATITYDNHPTWVDMSEKWLATTKRAALHIV